MSFEVPILFLGYNRPDLTLRTFTRILEITPTKLYVALDGPKVQRKNDFQKCQEVKEIITSNIKSGCVVHYKFNTVNQGCGLAVKSAIDWFFTSEEFGIIIEDDCLPTLSFFPFCEELLYKFRNVSHISHISGSNFQCGIWRGLGSYYFSKNTHIWGWATWRRAWKDYDVSMKEFKKSELFQTKNTQLPIELMTDVFNGKIDTWDIQWYYTNIIHRRLTIIPNLNLVNNIGFNDEATHTSGKVPSYIKYSRNGDLLFPLRHQYLRKANYNADLLVSIKIFGYNPNIILPIFETKRSGC